jgi:hypothetical protein
MNDQDMQELIRQVGRLADATRNISHGGVNGPTGLEMLGMAIAGEGFSNPPGEAIANGLDRVAAAIENGLGQIAEAISELKGN